MEVQAIDIDHIRRFLEGAFNVAILPHAIPNPVGAGFLVKNTVIGERLFGVNNRFKRFVLDLTSSAASSARLGDSATTAATGSPWYTALSTAIGKSRIFWAWSGPISMKGCVCAAISLPVSVHATPGNASAPETSMLTMRACAKGERTKRR